MAKALVLFSGGLDSRLVIKLLQEQGIDIEAVFFQLPLGEGCCNNFSCVLDYSQANSINLHIIDCTKEELLKEYLEIIKKPKHGRGTALNPCRDCKIFMLKKSKALKEKINADFIATGEVLGERPFSQTKQALQLIERKSGLVGNILRPLSAKLMPETEAEKKGLIGRTKLLDIQGRQRKKQIELAKKYNIKYPNPAGGCLLCDKNYSRKLIDLFKNKENIIFEDLVLLKIGRHFRKTGKIIIGKNKPENDSLEILNEKLNYYIIKQASKTPTALFENKNDENLVKKLINLYSSKDIAKRKIYESIRL